jgi:hypothetical protein
MVGRGCPPYKYKKPQIKNMNDDNNLHPDTLAVRAGGMRTSFNEHSEALLPTVGFLSTIAQKQRPDSPATTGRSFEICKESTK